MEKFVRIFTLSMLSIAAISAHANDAAYTLLQTMHDATRRLNYEGVVIYQHGAKIDSIHILHKYDGEIERERLTSLSGPAKEVVRDGGLVTVFSSRGVGTIVQRDAPGQAIDINFSAPLEKLVSSYNLVIEGFDRVAGRKATVVGVMPARQDRYGYKLWIDRDSKLLLKSMILSSNGRPLEQVQFTELRVKERIAAERLRSKMGDEKSVPRLIADNEARQPERLLESSWRVTWLPPGFERKESSIEKSTGEYIDFHHLVFSDGLAMVSVFVEQLAERKRAFQGYSSRGAVTMFGRVADDHQVTVVGDVPRPTIEKISTSIVKIDN